jgi:FkbM family methyltransferase
MHHPREAHDCIDFMGLSIDTINRPGTLHIANVESSIDFDETAFALEHFQQGDRILIAGGGMGGQAALVASKFGPESVVVVEPNPLLVRLLRGELRVRGKQLDIRQAALWTRDSTQEFYIADDNWPASSLLSGQSPNERGVSVETLDTNRLIAEESITALILDVEGAEKDIVPYLDIPKLRAMVVEAHGPYADTMAGHMVQGSMKIKMRTGSMERAVIGGVRCK